MLKINDLSVSVDNLQILKGLNLEVKAGEVHAIMGPNGSGKSTLAKVLSGHSGYEATGGTVNYEVNFKYHDLLGMTPEERAHNGVFLAFQYPIEIPGVSNFEFLRASFNAVSEAQGAEEMDVMDFKDFVTDKMKALEVPEFFLERQLNADFSGGEKKRNEILQMAVLSPKLAILDETDSGLDIDSMKTVASGVNKLKNKDNAIVLITHYQRLLNYITPDVVHILSDGKIVKSGDKSLALEVEENGYENIIHSV